MADKFLVSPQCDYWSLLYSNAKILQSIQTFFEHDDRSMRKYVRYATMTFNGDAIKFLRTLRRDKNIDDFIIFTAIEGQRYSARNPLIPFEKFVKILQNEGLKCTHEVYDLLSTSYRSKYEIQAYYAIGESRRRYDRCFFREFVSDLEIIDLFRDFEISWEHLNMACYLACSVQKANIGVIDPVILFFVQRACHLNQTVTERTMRNAHISGNLQYADIETSFKTMWKNVHGNENCFMHSNDKTLTL